jgi:LuxR family maltose regulon positive regulatory protein
VGNNGFGVTEEIEESGRRAAGTDAGGVVIRPALLRRLGGTARVTLVSGSPGSGKTALLRSWAGQTSLAGRAAWVTARHDERDPRRFWPTVADALRRAVPGSALVQPLTAAPDLDGWALVERLLADLAPLEEPAWLVADDVDELDTEVLRQLELLITRAPAGLRFVLASRRDLRLGLHRLRLEGELTEIREPDLRFSPGEAGELFAAAGVELPEPVLETLHRRTEGWAAGLRLAALSLAGHPDPEGFAAGFSGSERTVAEYLLAEVLDRQPAAVRRLLLRTSILERVNGELADLLTGDEGGERILLDLEDANAFVVPLDPARSWFRYHQMFAGLLRLELRRSAPGEVAALHGAASGWFAAHGYLAEAIRHAQAAGDWGLAARLLSDHWPGLHLDGQAAVTRDLLMAFPSGVRAADAELATVAGAYELSYGSLEAAGRYLDQAERDMASVPGARQQKARLRLGIARLLLARQAGDVPGQAEASRVLQAAADVPDAAQPCLGEDLRALALTGLGSAEYWEAEFDEAEQLLKQGIALANRIGRPFLECAGLAHLAAAEAFRSHKRAAGDARQAVELAGRHGWAGGHAAGVASMVLGGLLTWEGRLEEAEPWIQRAERAVRAEAQPVAGMWACLSRAVLELGRGRKSEALAAFRGLDRLASLLAAPTPVSTVMRALQLQILVLLGETGRAGQFLAGLGGDERERGETRVAAAALQLAQGNPRDAVAELGPVLEGTAPLIWPVWLVQAFLLEAIARDALGDPDAGRALEAALDRAEPDGILLPFLLYPAPGLIGRHARHHTAHAGLITEIRGLLAGIQPPQEPLRDSELRVLRYLPTNLTAPEIAGELSVSPHTVKTHMRNVYAKLGTHRRAEAVTRARDLGLLAPARVATAALADAGSRA